MGHRELVHLDAEQAVIQATVDEEIHIGLPEEFPDFLRVVFRLNNPIYGGKSTRRLVRACSASLWNVKLRWYWWSV